jgi:predicted adenylyl cyclase CyaB
VRETNVFYDRRGESLRSRDCGLRVRVSVGEDGVARGLLTFKGPPATTGVRAREAFDIAIDPVEQMGPLLAGLGFEQILLFEKDRETYELRGCLVELDELPMLGRFLEIEGPSEEEVRGVQELLGLEELPDVHDGYSKMARGAAGASGQLRF